MPLVLLVHSLSNVPSLTAIYPTQNFNCCIFSHLLYHKFFRDSKPSFLEKCLHMVFLFQATIRNNNCKPSYSVRNPKGLKWLLKQEQYPGISSATVEDYCMCTATDRKTKKKTKQNKSKSNSFVVPSPSKNYGPFSSYQCTTANYNGSNYFNTILQDYSLKLSQLRQVVARQKICIPSISATSFHFLWNVRRKKIGISSATFTEATITDKTQTCGFWHNTWYFSPLPWTTGYTHKGTDLNIIFSGYFKSHQVPFWEDRQFKWITRISG